MEGNYARCEWGTLWAEVVGTHTPGARQIPVEGAVTGPEAAPAQVDEVYGTASLDDLTLPPV